MRKPSSNIFYLALVSMLGCTDQLRGSIDSIIVNESERGIGVTYYRDGNEAGATIQLDPHESITILSSTAQHGVIYPVYTSSLALDSAVITFENKTAVHYNFKIFGKNLNAILYDGDRNFFNQVSWARQVLKNSRKHLEAQYSYTFTEDDYMNAN